MLLYCIFITDKGLQGQGSIGKEVAWSVCYWILLSAAQWHLDRNTHLKRKDRKKWGYQRQSRYRNNFLIDIFLTKIPQQQ